MAISVGSGIAAQLVVKDESTYGVAPSLLSGVDSFEFKSETLELKKTAIQGEGLSAGKVYARTKRRVLTNYDVTGDLSLELPTRNLGFWLRHMVGDFVDTPAQIASTGMYKTIFQPRSGLTGHSICIQKGVPAVDNATVEPFTYVGCKVTGWTINVSTGNIAQLTLTIDGRNELAGPFPNGGVAASGDPLNASTPPLANFSLPTSGLGASVFHFRQGTVFSGGVPTMTATSQTLTTPGIPASLTPVINTTGQTAMVTITGGTMTNVSINGVTVGAGAGTYSLPVGGTIVLTYSGPPTWAWFVGVLSLAGEAALGNVKDVTVQKAYGFDAARFFVGNNGFKGEPVENAYRALTGNMTIEWLSNEALYNAYAADATTSLQLTFTGPIGGTSGTNPYLLDIIIPNIKLDGESPKVPGPSIITQAVPFTGLDDETTTQMQITYQSEDISF